MKPIRWTNHALQNLADREVERDEVDGTLVAPESRSFLTCLGAGF